MVQEILGYVCLRRSPPKFSYCLTISSDETSRRDQNLFKAQYYLPSFNFRICIWFISSEIVLVDSEFFFLYYAYPHRDFSYHHNTQLWADNTPLISRKCCSPANRGPFCPTSTATFRSSRSELVSSWSQEYVCAASRGPRCGGKNKTHCNPYALNV